MVRSKYLGKVFDNGWMVTNVQIAGRYGKRKKAKGNSYQFVLSRFTSDGKCEKSLTVSHNTMVKLKKGLTTVERIEDQKAMSEYSNPAYYRFLAK